MNPPRTFMFIAALALLALAGCQEQVACTMDAKICPDGTAVGRVGPDCEFAACPDGSIGADQEVLIQSDDPDVCATIRYTCPDGYDAWSNELGCGCVFGDVACTEEAKGCPDGSSVSRVAPTCEFSACPDEPEQTLCGAEQRNVGACIEIYQPVCGWFDPDRIQCVTYPCAQTYSNSCFACDNPDVIAWTAGECPMP